MKTKISSGAEATIWKEKNAVVKERTEKKYRIKEIDSKLRKTRTRKEAKILTELAKISFPCPKVKESSDKTMTITMDHIIGEKVRDILEASDCKKLGKEIGNKVALLHNQNIIHGDLTTSNMIMHKTEKGIYFIDFGLAVTSQKIEDKAVDLHLLRQALESKHHTVWQEVFAEVQKAYAKKANTGKEILARLETVEQRGRNKAKF